MDGGRERRREEEREGGRGRGRREELTERILAAVSRQSRQPKWRVITRRVSLSPTISRTVIILPDSPSSTYQKSKREGMEAEVEMEEVVVEKEEVI